MARTLIRFKRRKRAFDLSATGIDSVSEWLGESLDEAGADKADRIRMRLLFEEALLNMAEHYGKEQEGTAYLERRQGRYRLRVVVPGSRFNPLKHGDEAQQDDLSMSLFSVIDMRVHYSYSVGQNVLRLTLPRKSWNPVLKIIVALLVGATIGLLGNLLIPDAAQEAFCDAVLEPISDVWIRLLQAISGPIIFLTALTAAMDTKRISEFGGSRLSALARFFTISALVVVFAMICSIPFFPLNFSATEASSYTFTEILTGILQVVPGNLVEPFSEANTPQLLLIAIATGYLLATIEPHVGELKVIILQLNTLGLTVANFACQLVPFFVGLLLCLRIWTHDTNLLGAIWLPFILATVLAVVAVVTVLVVASIRFRVSPLLLARKLKGSFFEALKRGTLDFSAVDNLADTCKRLLGINHDYARAVLPMGLFLYMPTSGIGICVFVLFAAQTQNLAVDQIWIIALAALSVVLAVATPPVTGANLLSFVMAFQYLHIPNGVFLDVMIFDLVFGVLCIAFDQTMLLVEMITQADKMGFLDDDVLHAPMNQAA